MKITVFRLLLQLSILTNRLLFYLGSGEMEFDDDLELKFDEEGLAVLDDDGQIVRHIINH